MKYLIYFAAVLFLVWNPQHSSQSQNPVMDTNAGKNSKLSILNQDTVVALSKKLDELIKDVPKVKEKIVYRTRWKEKVRVDTVYLPINWDPHDYEEDKPDTVVIVKPCPPCPPVKKKSKLGKLIDKIF